MFDLVVNCLNLLFHFFTLGQLNRQKLLQFAAHLMGEIVVRTLNILRILSLARRSKGWDKWQKRIFHTTKQAEEVSEDLKSRHA